MRIAILYTMQKFISLHKINKSLPITFTTIAILIIIVILTINLSKPDNILHKNFNSERAYKDVLYQMELGPRVIGSNAHAETVKWLQDELSVNSWEVSIHETNRLGVCVQNVIAKRGMGRPWIILGAHYDSRSVADEDPNPLKAVEPVPGANDGASGIALLLELSRVLSKRLDLQIWLVFFDAEDNGNIQGQDWILGSRAFVNDLDAKPDMAVIVDMIGDADLNIYWEKNSDAALTKEIWNIADQAGYSRWFIPEYKYSILDDHTPFLQAGVPAVDIIDFDYPYYHTSADTADKVSPESLSIVGNTLILWLEYIASK